MPSDKDFFENNAILKQINNQIQTETTEEARDRLEKKNILTFNELMSLPTQENNYLIENLLWERQVVILLAREKVGKSVLSKHMACSLSSGEPFLNTFHVKRPLRVLYIQLEGDMYETNDRLKRMKMGVKVNPDNFFFMFKPRIYLDIEVEMMRLCAEIDEMDVRPDVIFIDPLYTAIKGSISKDDVASSLIGNLRLMQQRYRCSMMLVHHAHKPIRHKEGFFIDEGDDAIMGSSYLKNFANHVILLTKDKHGVRTMGCTTQRNGDVFKDIKLEMIQPEPLMFKLYHKGATIGEDDLMKRLLMYGGEFNCDIISQMTNMSEGSVRNRFTELKQKGLIVPTKRGFYKVKGGK